MQNEPPKLIRFIFPTFDNLIWMASFFWALLRGRQMINADGDLTLHLNLGKYILNTGKIPLKDMFSHTMTGKPVVQHEWFSTVILEFINNVFGLSGVIFLMALVIATTFWLLFIHIRVKYQTPIIGLLVVLLTMIITTVHWIARPHIFTFLFLTLWMLNLNRLYEGGFKNWWFFPILMILWVNMHGGFIIGFITWFIYGIGTFWDAFIYQLPEDKLLRTQFWRYYLLGGATSFVVSLINPSGIDLWIKITSHIGNKYLADITVEFRTPNFHEVSTWPFLFFIALLIVVIGLCKRKGQAGLLFNVSVWLVMALYSGRNIPLFAIVAAPLLVMGLIDIVSQATEKITFLEKFSKLEGRILKMENKLSGVFWPLFCLLLVGIALSMGIQFDIEGEGYTFNSQVFPIKAVDWLEKNPQEGQMFNYFAWGGYLEYHLWPKKKVFIDSKSDFFGEDFVRQYMKVIQLEKGWESVINQYNVSWAILPKYERAVEGIQEELGWEIIYQDNMAVILKEP